MCYQPPSIACSSIFMAARHLQLPLPNNPPWYSIFNVTLEEIREICLCLFKLYTRPKLTLKIIDKTLTVARKLYEVNKSNFKDSPSDSVAPSSPTKVIKESTDLPPSQLSLSGDNKDNSSQNSPPKTNATAHKYDDRDRRSGERKRDSGMEYERKRSRRHHKNKHSSPASSPKYKYDDEKNYEGYNNHQGKHKSSRHKPTHDPDLDNLVLARQRQSLLYSIQEQKSKSSTKPDKPLEGEERESVKTKEYTDRADFRKDGPAFKKSVVKDQNHVGESIKVVKEKESSKNGIYPNHSVKVNSTDDTPSAKSTEQPNTKTDKSINQEININFNPNRRTNTYVPEKKRIVISLKSSPKIKSPKHKHSTNLDDVLPKKRHKKR